MVAKVHTLIVSTEVLIVYGYFLLIWLIGGLCVGVAAYKLYQSWVAVDRLSAQSLKTAKETS